MYLYDVSQTVFQANVTLTSQVLQTLGAAAVHPHGEAALHQ
jgi:hypothetical protein